MGRRHPHRTTLTRLLLTPTVAAGVALGLTSAPAQAAVWSTCDQWGNTSLDGYTLYNNIWGSGAGRQCLTADSGTKWSVRADHPNTSGIKSYPNAKKVVGKPVDSLASLKSSYKVTVPSAGDYNTSYDIWDTDYDYEIMLWVNRHGNVGPLGTPQGTARLGGHTWDVYKGSNGNNEVFSFLRTSDSSTGTVDILPILKWIKNTKGWMGNETIGDVQFGYEISGAAGGLDFRTNALSTAFGAR
ncbi:glycoside hydrolase family 12 protein [Streptomyces sp. Je 1-369]|uniref:glycoside hydrolase family 12 protein n=1 Tax=Streptomyces sp. Je 1-369 TaxID=2966192 RepID=UPI00228603A8|nr:hypothetical protein [Streptomyces sp. Je 1-369]WAL98909.1 hypothetical protein NOO62_33185 [Streptomyces sp. Je 1-369]